MQQKSINFFVDLLESVIKEDSSTIALVRKSPGANILIPYMHKNLGLSHDQEYEEVKKLSWSDVKSKNRWNNSSLNWVIVKGEQGVGAIAATDNYKAIAVYDGEVVNKSSDRGGTIIDWLKGYIGRIQYYYVGKDSGETKKKKSARKATKPVPTENYVDVETFLYLLMKKFKPLWIRALEQAQADIKGFMNSQLKSNAYDKADKKLARLKAIDHAVRAIDDGQDPTEKKDRYSDPFEIMRAALTNAILMTAHHYYPNETGGFRDRARGYGRSAHALNNPSAVAHIFNDIRDGDTKKLGTLLGFFKKGLISG